MPGTLLLTPFHKSRTDATSIGVTLLAAVTKALLVHDLELFITYSAAVTGIVKPPTIRASLSMVDEGEVAIYDVELPTMFTPSGFSEGPIGFINGCCQFIRSGPIFTTAQLGELQLNVNVTPAPTSTQYTLALSGMFRYELGDYLLAGLTPPVTQNTEVAT